MSRPIKTISIVVLAAALVFAVAREGYVKYVQDLIFGFDELERARELTLSGRDLVNRSHYDQAENLFLRALHHKEAALGIHHPEIAVDLENLGGALAAQHK